MRATIVAGAPVPGQEEYYRRIVVSAEYLIAADSGAISCRAAGRVPDLLVGDLDSITPDVLSWVRSHRTRVLSAPREKDVTDLDLALRAARDSGARSVTVSGAWSGRLDHTVAALGSIARAPDLMPEIADPGVSGWLLTPGFRPHLTLVPRGALCSLFALDPGTTVTTVGLKYELSSSPLEPLSSLGLSNVILLDQAKITVESGTLLVISAPGDDGSLARHTDGG